ncbi:MAG: esterase/lipase family protein, partial [Planctomycetia bacterium]
AASSCELAKKCDWHAVDGYYTACEEAWNAVWTCPGSQEILCAASEAYATALEGLLESARCHGRLTGEGLVIGPAWNSVRIPIQTRSLCVDAAAIESIEATCRPADRRISRRHARGGFGLPVSVRLGKGPVGSVSRDFAPRRQAIAATAVLRFQMPGGETPVQKFSGPLSRDHAAAILDLANPVEIAAVHIGPAQPLLAADLTAPLLDMLESLPRTNAIQGFVQPFGSGDTQPKLEFLEPHQPGRIPVVFIHGLASDEGTWFDMLNELRAWPTFHRRFEPWVYNYPTGASFLQSARMLRRELAAAVRRLDPQGKDPALASLVLVGHSMGGPQPVQRLQDGRVGLEHVHRRRQPPLVVGPKRPRIRPHHLVVDRLHGRRLPHGERRRPADAQRRQRRAAMRRGDEHHPLHERLRLEEVGRLDLRPNFRPHSDRVERAVGDGVPDGIAGVHHLQLGMQPAHAVADEHERRECRVLPLRVKP